MLSLRKNVHQAAPLKNALDHNPVKLEPTAVGMPL
jgi:hypothetical protein